MLIKRTLFLFVLLAGGLSSASQPPLPEEAMALPEELIHLLDQSLSRLSPSDDQKLDALIELMFSQDGLRLKYIAEPTRNVTETFLSGDGNCLSFTLLFLAMADHAKIRASAREVQMPLAWRRQGSTLFETGHVNVLVSTLNRRAIVDFEPDALVAHRAVSLHRGREISRERVLAHFYNNRAAEILTDGDLGSARLWSDQALSLDPGFVQALNNRGVLETRAGQVEEAQKFYEKALEEDPSNVSTLLNLINLHDRTNEPHKAEAYRTALEGLRPQDPFFLWRVGQEYETGGELRRARRLYRRALTLLPDEASFLVSLATVSKKLGDLDLAHDALSQAIRGRSSDIELSGYELEQLLAMKMQLQDGNERR